MIERHTPKARHLLVGGDPGRHVAHFFFLHFECFAGLARHTFADPGGRLIGKAPLPTMGEPTDPSSRNNDEFPARMPPGEHLVGRSELIEPVGLAHRGTDGAAVDNLRYFRQLRAVGPREGAVETCLAGAGTFDERSDTCRSLLCDWRRKTNLAKGLGVRNADQTDIAAALTQGVNPALDQRSANAVIDDIERSGVLELFTCIVDRTVGPELRHEILATGTSSCDDEGAHVFRELDCEGADAAGSGLYQHALARLELRPLYERLPGRQRDRRKARGFFKGKRSRFASQEANGNNGTLGISTKPAVG